MSCDRCRRPEAIFQPYSGNRFCDQHFIRDFDRKVKKAVRCSGGIGKGERVAVALSGGPSSCALARAFSGLLSGRKDAVLSAVTVDKGGTERIRIAGEIAADLGIIWSVGGTVDLMAPDPSPGAIGLTLCRLARQTGASRLAFGSTVEDCAYRVFTALSSGELHKTIRNGTAKPGVNTELIIIHPISAIPEREARLYAELTMGIVFENTTYGCGSAIPSGIRTNFMDFCRRHPSTPFALVKLGEELGFPLGPVMPRLPPGPGDSPAVNAHPGV